MNAAPSIDVVYQAIHTLHFDSDVHAKEKASIWLDEFQKSVFAWSISDAMLREDRDLESSYFAAQTMRRKIQSAFHELPQESYESLRESLFSDLRASGSASNHVIVVQLCLALADLYLQVPAWKDCVVEIIGRLQKNGTSTGVLLEILGFISEELVHSGLRIGDNRRKEIRNEILPHSAMLLNFLEKCVETHHDNAEILLKVLKCVSSWLAAATMPIDQAMNSPVVESVFAVLANASSPNSLHEAATDVVLEITYIIEDRWAHESEAKIVFQSVHQLLPVFHQFVALEDHTKLMNLARIFTSFAESLLERIVEEPNRDLGSFSTLDILLVVVGHHDYSLADLTFNFWYRLSEYIYMRNDDVLRMTFQPYIERLVIALYRHCRFDPDHEGIPNENEDFCEFRHLVTEVIKDVVFVVGSTALFRTMFQYAKQNASWDETESVLFIMTSVAKNLIAEEEEVVPEVVEAILNLPDSTHICIWYTSIQLFGELSHWFNVNASYLDRVFSFLQKCMKHPKLSGVAITALEALASSCRGKLLPQFDSVLQLFYANEATANASAETNLQLLKAIVLIMSDMPREELSQKFYALCQRQSQPLINILNSNEEKAGQHLNSTEPIIWMDRLMVLFRHLTVATPKDAPHPCLNSVQEIWPVLLRACQQYEENLKAAEHCCRTLRFVIRALGIQSLPFITPLVNKMFEIYQRHPHSCFLYLGSVLVDEYGEHGSFVPGLVQMLEAFVDPAFKILQMANNLRNCSDTVDDLFRLALRFVQKAPVAFFLSDKHRPLFACAVTCIMLDHRDACQSVSKFVVEVLMFVCEMHEENKQISSARNAEQVVNDYGASLVHNVIFGSVYHLSMPLHREMAEIIYAIKVVSSECLAQWLAAALKALPQQGTLTASTEQLQNFHHEIVNPPEAVFPFSHTTCFQLCRVMGDSGENGEFVSTDIKELRKNWQMLDDFSLAQKLQEKEYDAHYDKNRRERRLVGSDVRLSRQEQDREDELARVRREHLLQEQEKRDRQLALALQRQRLQERKFDACFNASHKEQERHLLDNEISSHVGKREQGQENEAIRQRREQEESDRQFALALQQELDFTEMHASRLRRAKEKTKAEAGNSSENQYVDLEEVCGNSRPAFEAGDQRQGLRRSPSFTKLSGNGSGRKESLLYRKVLPN